MFSSELDSIINIVEEILGEPKKSYSIDQWWEFNCPNCSMESGVQNDNKYNLCVNFQLGAYHCWKCEDAGKLSKLIRTYGGEYYLRRYYQEIRNLRNAKRYTLDQENGDITDDIIEDDVELLLPEGCQNIGNLSNAYKYLRNRGLNETIINRFKIKYTAWDNKNFKLKNRIIIPSYDAFGQLNYWVGRDYTGKAKLKYCNPQIEKKKIIFNEKLINWYENVTLVEGVFDHMVVPNSIPLLGKKLDSDFAVYDALINKAMVNVNILLDSDATEDAMRMYKFLNRGILKDRIRLIECRNGYDASLIYEKFGKDGILKLMKRAKKIDEFDLLMY